LTAINKASQANPSNAYAQCHPPRCKPREDSLWRRVFLDDPLDLVFICRPVFLEEVVSVSLGWGVWVRLVEQILDAQEDLLDGDSRLPCIFLVQDGQADSAGGVNVGVEERWDEFA
jgi:hypothetical protein